MEKFHITITDNETGETLVNLDTCAIIGAMDEGDLGTSMIDYEECNSICLAATITGAQVVANRAMKDLPMPLRWQVKTLVKAETRKKD